MASLRAVFYVTDKQAERLESIDLQIKKVGGYASDAFEEWLKRREGRALRARIQKKKYMVLLDDIS